MNQDHTVNGIRIIVIPLARRSSVVVMKLRAPISDARQKMAMLVIHKSAPIVHRVRLIGPCAQRRVAGPPMQGRAARHEEGREDHDEADKGRPERQHVQDRECHVRRADLNGQEIVAETALRRRGQHEEHHDRAVHRHQSQISLGLHLAQQWEILQSARSCGSASSAIGSFRRIPR